MKNNNYKKKSQSIYKAKILKNFDLNSLGEVKTHKPLRECEINKLNIKMKNYLTFFLLLAVLVFSVANVSALALTNNIVTANNTEQNTGTPTISVNVTGNCTNYYANLTLNNVRVLTDYLVTNNTNTNLVATTSTNPGNYRYNVSFWNNTCDSALVNWTDYNNIEINRRPTISAVTGTAGALLYGKTMTWTTTWTDENSTGTDNVTFYACKTDAFTTSCTGGEWGHSSGEMDNSTAVTYTITASDTGGTKNYYVYAIDNNNFATTSGTSGTFVVSRPLEGESDIQPGVTTTQTEDEGLPLGLIAVVAILVIVVLAVLNKRR